MTWRSRTLGIIFGVLLSSSQTAVANGVVDPATGLVELASRRFLLSTDMSDRVEETEAGFIFLTRLEWLRDLVSRDPVLNATTIEIEDRRDPFGTPIWPADQKERFHPAPELATSFDETAFDVWRIGVSFPGVPPRGTVIFVPKGSEDRYFVFCGYDADRAGLLFCSLTLRYAPDPNLDIEVHIWRVRDPLDDFQEIADRVEALVRCLDVTESRSGSASLVQGRPEQTDIEPGGACRPPDMM